MCLILSELAIVLGLAGDYQAQALRVWLSEKEYAAWKLGQMLMLWRRISSPQIRSLGTQLRTKTIDLYSQILKYQIHLARQYSRAGFFRFLRDLFVVDRWKEMFGTLKETEESINKDLQILDIEALGNIDLNMSRLQGKADDILTGLSGVRNEVEV